MGGTDLKRVDARSRRGGTKAEDVVIRDVVRECDQRGFQIFFVLESEVAATGEVCDCFGGFYFERAARGDEGHRGEAKRRSELADAVEDLLAVVAFVFDVGAFLAEATVRGARIFVVEFRGFVSYGGVGAVKGEAV